jgi:hypothetical protein
LIFTALASEERGNALQVLPMNRFARTMRQTTWIDPRKGFLRFLSDDNIFFDGEYPFPKNFQRAFYMQIEKVE